MRIRIEFLRKVSHIFDAEHARIQQDLLHTLQANLSTATSKVEVAIGLSKGLRKLGYLFMRQSIDKLMADLDNWQKVFDPTWFLIIRISNPLIDSGIQEWKRLGRETSNVNDGPVDIPFKLRHIGNVKKEMIDPQIGSDLSINLDDSGLKGAIEIPIPFTAPRIFQREGLSKLLLVETIPCPESGNRIDIFKANVENLARKLKQLESGSCGLLRCYGTVKRRSPQRRLVAIDMIFRTPDKCRNPCTLRQILLEQVSVSFTQIISLVKQVARAISFFHTCDFVHKSIRPENVLVFLDNSPVLDSKFLVGYEQPRHAYFQTELRGNVAWHRNLYRHPQRQGILAQERYIMQHDILQPRSMPVGSGSLA